MERAVIFGTCPQCDGTRLADPARTCFIDGRSIADACAMQISDLAQSSLIHGHLSPMDDVVTYRLVDSGRTVVVIAPPGPDGARRLDHRMGPGAGHDGGRVVFAGIPAQMVADRTTLTSQYLTQYVEQENDDALE